MPRQHHDHNELQLPEAQAAAIPLPPAAIPPTAIRHRCGRPGMSEHRVTIERMRPALKPGLLTVWRNRDTVQIGIDPRRAIALTGMRGAAVLLGLLDGSRDLAQILAAAGDAGISAEAADRVITLLAVGGALHDFPVTAYRAMPQGLRTRLAPELATAALAHGDADGGARILARRQGACVRVEGMSRVGLCLASFLTASGIGTVISAGRTPGAGTGCGTPPPALPRPPTFPRRPSRVRPRSPAGLPSRVHRRAPAGRSFPARGNDRAGPRQPSSRSRDPRRHLPPRAARDPPAWGRPAPGRSGQRSDRRGRAAGAAGEDGVPAMSRPDPGRARSRLAAHPGSAHRRRRGSTRLRHGAGGSGGHPGRRAGPCLRQPARIGQRCDQRHAGARPA